MGSSNYETGEGFTTRLKAYSCICEKKQHWIDVTNSIWSYVAYTIDTYGEMVNVNMMGKKGDISSYSVHRIFIAIHGIKGENSLIEAGYKKT